MKWLVKYKIPSGNSKYYFISDMNKYKGKVLEMTSDGENYYKLNDDACTYFFHKNWLETPYVRVKASLHSRLYSELVGRKLTIKKEESYNGICHFEETYFTCSRLYLEPWVDGEKWDSSKWIKEGKEKEGKSVYLVIKNECGVYKPSVNPITHLTEESALNEAKRLSKNSYHEQSFSVFREIHVEKVVKPKYEIGTQLKVNKEPYEFEKNSVITITEVKDDGYIVSGLVGITIGQKKIGIQSLENMNLEVVFRVKDEIPF